MSHPLILKDHVESVGQGRFTGLVCGDCGAKTFPARSVCASCGSRRLETTEIKGPGIIRTFTVIRVAPAGFEPPYIVALVELSEGPWVMGNLDGVDPDQAGPDLIGRTVTMGSRELSLPTYGADSCRALTFSLS